jgi:TATA-box binding protein (TBP) (component of TFIID and TFIIIB)
MSRQPRFEPLKVQNVVCQAYLGIKDLNMAVIAQALNGRFGYKTFPACSSRCRNTGTVNIIFATGAVIIVGSRDMASAVLSGTLLVDRLRRDLNLPVGLYNLTQV